jgi:catalase
MPVNVKVNNYQRDRSMMVHANGGGAPNYFPNSFLSPTPSADSIWHSDSVSGGVLIPFPKVSST